MSKAEESTLSEKTSEAGERLTEGSGLRDVASRVVQDGKTVAQRWGRQSLSAAGSSPIVQPITSSTIRFALPLSVS